jgi:hypothetical protein
VFIENPGTQQVFRDFLTPLSSGFPLYAAGVFLSITPYQRSAVRRMGAMQAAGTPEGVALLTRRGEERDGA